MSSDLPDESRVTFHSWLALVDGCVVDPGRPLDVQALAGVQVGDPVGADDDAAENRVGLMEGFLP